MDKAKNIIIIAILIVLLFFICNKPKVVVDRVITTVDTVILVKEYIQHKKGKDIFHKVIVTDTVYHTSKIHDTAFIIKDYGETKVYLDTLHISTSQYVSIEDTLWQNRIIGRGYMAHLEEKTITITNDIYHKPKNELHLGLVGDFNRLNDRLGVGVGVIFKKQNESYSITYTTNQISVGIYKKLF